MNVSRRSLLAATALVPLVGGAPDAVAAPTASGPVPPRIRPRSEWAGTLAPRGPLEPEDDVRFLLVHHTLTPNTDAPDRTPDRLRAVYRFHTGERGWPDVAYNFFIDRHGVVWEGREGSLAGAVRGDATGGSQGHALLCCFVGDFTAQPPTEAAMASMTALLAWLAGREGLTLAEPVTFTSRGSNRWRRGEQVTTEQIAAHRDMSRTECPGDALYPLVASTLLPAARAALAGPAASPTPSPTPTPEAPPAASTPPDEPVSEGTARTIGAVALGAGLLGTALAVRRRSEKEQDEQHDGADDQGAEQADEEPLQGH